MVGTEGNPTETKQNKEPTDTVKYSLKPKRKRKSEPDIPPPPPSCWEICRECLFTPDDSVHICLGDLFVTRAELERMLNPPTQPQESQR